MRRSLALLSASLMALVLAAPALATTPVNLRSAESYSVLADAVTSNGATAMVPTASTSRLPPAGYLLR